MLLLATPPPELARAWLAFTGNAPPTVVPDGGVFPFRFPATLSFEVVLPGGSVKAAQSVARRALDALDASDTSVGGIEGPLPSAHRSST